MVDIDEQLAKAEERVKRLKQKKVLKDAKDAIAENKALKERVANLQKSLQDATSTENARDLVNLQDDINWTRSAIENLINELDNRSVVINQGKKNQWNGINFDYVKERLNKILQGQQPTGEK